MVARLAKCGWRGEAALLLACLMLIEALFGGLAIGARAETVPPGFTILCSGTVVSGPALPGGHGSHIPDCCTLGCPMLGGFLPAAAVADPHVPPALEGPRRLPSGEASTLARAELAPLHSRAPPAA